ncbi:MAG: cytochrome C [Candidatus Tectomicrobia bacterium]|uniref:Cytochrome C n=1 Tax=Tectimicrobiota bacterium TaxID=2528274 RepID=A0A932GNS5_UNCTE|nr:cytochrome C [Candidatus Tectomicrobia bacterium]
MEKVETMLAEKEPGTPQAPEFYVRFNVRQRLEHFFVMFLFLVLAVTGLPQKFYQASWAQWIILFLGGIDWVRIIHRVSGILFAFLGVVHLGMILVGVLLGRIKPILIPTLKDFRDAVQQLRYHVGLTDEHPRFERYDYKQKFEYWGLVFGGMVMITTGFILYLPNLATRYLTGELIPAAKVAHSNEGLLAFLVVIIWHMYGTHFNPDVFPMDTSIFTGKISRERMLHEHPLELLRISAGSPEEMEPGRDGAHEQRATASPAAERQSANAPDRAKEITPG